MNISASATHSSSLPSPLSPTAAPLQIRVLPTADTYCIGYITLDNPATLNALSLPVVQVLEAQLRAWATDPSIVAVVIDSSSEKAFCAGGDLQMLYRSMQNLEADAYNETAATFFATEYRLDYLVHRFPKPIVMWLHGVTMGGGVGLAFGARYRIVTETACIAMPEMHIGLFPDVGGSWFLSRMPAQVGRYLALTAARLTAADAIALGLADLPIQHQRKQEIMQRLQFQTWSHNEQLNDEILRQILTSRADWSLLNHAPFMSRWPAIVKIAHCASLAQMLDALTQQAKDDAWFVPHRQTLAHGSPATAILSCELQRRARLLDLPEVFRLEFAAALGCCAYGDLREGIRALIIEKDKQPRWRLSGFEQADHTLVEKLLEKRWEGEHPLIRMEDEIR